MLEKPDLKIVLIGMGGYGENYARLLLSEGSHHGAQLIAGVDPCPEGSSFYQAFRHSGIPIYPNLESFYEAGSAELAVISTPIHLHAPQTRLALAHGSNVLCEKPLCATLEEASRMAEAEAESGRFVAIGYQWSFTTAFQALKQAILAGELGRPVRLKSLVLWPRRRSYFRRNPWAGRIRLETGEWVLDSPAHNAGAHYLHNMFFLLGDRMQTSAWPEKVESQRWRANSIENFDAAAMRCWTAQGAEILFYAAHPVPEEVGPVLRFEFERAVVEYPSGAEKALVARFVDGSVRSFGAPDLQDMTKLWQSVQAAQAAQAGQDARQLLALGIEGATPQVACIQAMHQYGDIQVFPTERLRTLDQNGDVLIWVDGLAEALTQAYVENRLLYN